MCFHAILGSKTTLAHKQADAEHDPWLLHKYPLLVPWSENLFFMGAG